MKPAIIAVDPALAERFGLRQRKADKPGELPRYAPEDILQHVAAIQADFERAVRVPASQQSDADRAVLVLAWRVQGLQRANAALRVENVRTEAEALAALQRASQAEGFGAPQVVPPATPEQRWRSLAHAAIQMRLADILKQDPPPGGLVELLAAVLSAHQDQNAAAFNRAVADYTKGIARLDLPPSAFDYQLPQGWTELGMPERPASHYGDVRATGHPIAGFEVVDAGERASVTVHHFNMKVGKAADTMNSWRIGQGLAPLPPAKASAAVGKLRIANRDEPLFQILTPSDVGRPIERLLATIVSPGGDAAPHTFEVSFYGDPPVLERHREKFETFVRSWRIGSARELSAWFPLPDKPVQPLSARMLAVILPDGPNRLRTFKLIGEPTLKDRHVKEFGAFVRSLGLPKDGKGKPTWKLPESWTEFPGEAGAVLVIDAASTPLPVEMEPLAEAEEGSVVELVNAWRAMFALPAVQQADLAKVTERIEVGGQTFTMVSLSSEPQTPPVQQ